MRFLYYIAILIALSVTTHQFLKLASVMYEGWFVVAKENLRLKEAEIVSNNCSYGGVIKNTHLICMSKEEAEQLKFNLLSVPGKKI